MPRGRELSNSEIRSIYVLKAKGLSHRDIASRIKRSKTVITNLFSKNENYGTKKRAGRKPKLSLREPRQVFRLTSNSMVSSSDVQAQLTHHYAGKQLIITM